MARRPPGLRVRFAAEPGLTPRGIIDKPIYLPAVLNEFSWEEEFSHDDYEGPGGEASTPGVGGEQSRRLRSTDLEALTLTWDAPWLPGDFLSPWRALRILERLGRAKRPFEIYAAVRLGEDEPEELRTLMTLRSLSPVLRSGQGDARYITLRLREWSDNRTDRRGYGDAHARLPTTHKLLAATTFEGLAKRYRYRRASDWRLIARANGLPKWSPSVPIVRSRRFKVGDKVKIPKPPTH